MHELMRRTGSANPNQFAQWFDEATASWTDVEAPSHKPSKRIKQVTATKDQKKWYRIARGQQPLSERTLEQLARLFPDVRQYFFEGPDRLWEALWGPVHRLWDVCAVVFYDTPFRPNCEIESDVTVVTTYAGPSLTFDESLYNFECALLLRPYNDDGNEYELRDLSDSIAMYRLHQAVSALAKTDGVGAYRCVRACMDTVELWDQFDAFNTFSSLCVYDAINRELTETEIQRLKNEPSYRDSVRIGVGDIEQYAKWPRFFCSNKERMEILRIAPPERYQASLALQTY